jgi:hypothetical protein
MTELKREDMYDIMHMLFFDILQELKEINSKLGSTVAQDDKATEAKPEKVCKYCGEVHERPVDYATCAKKHKKEGA